MAEEEAAQHTILSIEDCTVQELAHPAEIGLRIVAESAAALYACMAVAMFDLTGASARPNTGYARRVVSIEAPDPEALLVDWLSELLYLYETTGDVFPYIEVLDCQPTRLVATIGGAPLATVPAMHIKAVTYHDLMVRQQGDVWVAQVFFDI
jgi:SHS2 domain-containing protein